MSMSDFSASICSTDAPRVYQNGEFVGYDSLIREFFVQHSTFLCPELCIRGKFRGDKKRLSERGLIHAVLSLPVSWRARGLSFPLMFLTSLFLQPITIGSPEERGLGNLGGSCLRRTLPFVEYRMGLYSLMELRKKNFFRSFFFCSFSIGIFCFFGSRLRHLRIGGLLDVV